MTINLKMILELESRAAKAELEATAKVVKKLGDETAAMGVKGKGAAASTDALGSAARKAAANLNSMDTAGRSAAQGAAQIGQNAIVAAGNVGALRTAFTGFGQMAASAAGTVAGSLLAIVNPANLLTGIVIGAGTAMVNWLFSAGDAAENLQDKIESLKGSIADWREQSSKSAADLFKEFGQITPEIVAMQRELLAIDVRRIAIEAAEASRAMRQEFGAVNVEEMLGLDRVNARQMFPQVAELRILMDEAARASGPSDQAAGWMQVATLIRDSVGGVKKMNLEQLNFYNGAVSAANALRLSAVATGDVETGLGGAADQADLLEQASQAVRDALASASGINLSGVFSGAFGAADTLLGKVGAIIRAAGEANAALANQQAAANAQLNQIAFGNSPGGQALSAYGGRTAGGTSEQRALETRNTPKVTVNGGGYGGGGGGAGATAIQAEANALQDLIGKLNDEITALQTQDPIQKEMLQYREALAGATDAERKQVEALIIAREKEALAVEGMKASKEFFEQTALNALDALINKGESLQDVLKNVAAAFLKAAIQGALFGQGPFGAFFGGKSILAGVFGGVAGKADGGMIYGKGSGRSDSELRALSVGEYVVNAKATARNRHLLEAINAGSSIPGLAGGGAVDSGRRMGSGGFGRDARGPVRLEVHVHGARGDKELKEMARQGTREMIAEYDRGSLPTSMKRVSRDAKRLG